MKLRFLFSSLLVAVVWSGAYTQVSKTSNIWYFGNLAGLDFNSGIPLPLLNSAMYAFEGCASIADTNGKLLFYTNGSTIWNRNHLPMPNGTGLHGFYSSSQAAAIIPDPGSHYRYYVFTDGGSHFAPNPGLYYSIVDMTLDGGMGDVTLKNVYLQDTISEKMTAVHHCNGRDIWLIIHDCCSDDTTYHVYLISPSGISSPVVSPIGSAFTHLGCSKICPNGQRHVSAVSNPSFIQVANFDNLTGTLSDPFSLYLPGSGLPYGIEFSPSGRFLYVSPGYGDSLVYQFDLQAGTPALIQNSAIAVGAFVSGFPHLYGGALQLATDGKIYVANFGTDSLHVINSPNLPGTACNMVRNQTSLGGRTAEYGLPTFVQSVLPSQVTFVSSCFGDSTLLYFAGGSSPDSILWDFGDPASGQNSATGDTVLHVFSTPGVYFVSLSLFFGGSATCYTRQVQIHSSPNVDLGPDKDLCLHASTQLSVTPSLISNLWSTGETTSAITVQPSVTTAYWVIGTDANGCTDSDTVIVNVHPLPVVDAGEDQSICEGQQAQLAATGASAYLWSTGETTSSITVSPLSTTTYYVTGTDTWGCEDDDDVTVNVFAAPAVAAIPSTICAGEQALLTATGAMTYSWQPGGMTGDSVIVTPNITTTYTVTGTDSNGCESSSTVTVTVRNDCPVADPIIKIPTAFSPNSDGLNDIFRIEEWANFTLIAFKVFNRWGEIVFETGDITDGWNGETRGNVQQLGSYAFIILGVDAANEPVVVRGNVTLVR